MEKFETGDFITVKDIDNYKLKWERSINAYEINSFTKDGNILILNKEEILIKDVEPIPINNNYFYFVSSIIPMAPPVGPNGEKTEIKINDNGYLNDLEIKEILKNKDFKFVHELQHYLEKSNKGELLIRYI